MAEKIYSVGQFTKEVRYLLEAKFRQIWVEGEISNLAAPSSGHLYFTLKDDNAQIRCAFFRNRRLRTASTVADGQLVHLRGRPSLYEARGEFQIIVDYIELAGEGLLRRRFDELKNSLNEEGLFNASHKLSLPKIPKCIGIVTSLTGAAIKDIVSTLKRRYPIASVLIYPTLVQGEEAAPGIVDAIALANQMQNCNVLILARGGGSIEDLWAFNEVNVVRAIYNSEIPVVTGIGHEIDITLADLAADYRAETPTAAAESVTPDSVDIINIVFSLDQRLQRRMDHVVQNKSQQVDILTSRLRHPMDLLHIYQQQLTNLRSRFGFAHRAVAHKRELKMLALHQKLSALTPKRFIGQYHMSLTIVQRRLQRLEKALTNERGRQLSSAVDRLRALSPDHTLQRGYSILRDAADGKLLSNIDAIYNGQTLKAEMSGGWIESTVDRTRKDPRSIALRRPRAAIPQKKMRE